MMSGVVITDDNEGDVSDSVTDPAGCGVLTEENHKARVRQ